MKKVSIGFVFILGFVGFVTSFGAHIVAVTLPFYIEQVGAGLMMVGLLIAVFDIAEIISKPLFGTLADKKGMKKTMQVGILIFILSSLLYPVVSPKLLILIRFFQGIGAAALSAVSLAMVGAYYKENKGRAYGIYNAIKGMGYVISPLIGGAIILKNNFNGIFFASALIGCLALLLSLLLPQSQSKTENALDDDDDLSFASFIAVFKDSRLWPWYIVIVINMFFVGILFGFLPVHIHNLNFSPLKSGILLSVIAIAYLGIQPVAGWLADKMDQVLIIRCGLILSGISTAVIPFTSGFFLPVVCVLAGIGIGTVWTNSDTLVSHLSKEGKLGATMGAAGSFKEFGDMIGPLLMGGISQLFDLTTGFVACGTLGIVAIVFTLKNHNKK